MKIIITGAYAIGTFPAKLLSRNNEDITLIDQDGERLARLGSNYELLTIKASSTHIKALKEASVGRCIRHEFTQQYGTGTGHLDKVRHLVEHAARLCQMEAFHAYEAPRDIHPGILKEN